MKTNPERLPQAFSTALCLTAALLAGCTVIGPKAISTGRLAYNEVIAETNNQQMLMVLINNRYEEQGSMLAVASVTANVSVRSSAGFQAGFGGESSYQGNLVPISGGVVYEENPTISYTPVSGERYLRELTLPLPVSMLAQITRTMINPESVFLALISSVNGIYNEDFFFTEKELDPRFGRFAAIMGELTRAHRLHWVENPGQQKQFSIVIDQSAPDHAAMAKELLELVGLSRLHSSAPQLVLPVTLSLDGARQGELGITTRSIVNMVEILAARIEIPQRDIDHGVVAKYPAAGALGQKLAIHYSLEKPEHAYVSVRHRDGWFYIDERDGDTKRYFKLLGSLWSLAVASSLADGPAAPVLTVPVSN